MLRILFRIFLPCSACNGDGTRGGLTCRICGGTGEDPYGK